MFIHCTCVVHNKIGHNICIHYCADDAVSRLKGQVRLSFSRRPYSHWSVAFAMPPQLDVDVTSRVQGRSFSHVTSLVSSQVRPMVE